MRIRNMIHSPLAFFPLLAAAALAVSVGTASIAFSDVGGGLEDGWTIRECDGSESSETVVFEWDKLDNLPGPNYQAGSDVDQAVDAASEIFLQIMATHAKVQCSDCARTSQRCPRAIHVDSTAPGALSYDAVPVKDEDGIVTGYNVYVSFWGKYTVSCEPCGQMSL